MTKKDKLLYVPKGARELIAKKLKLKGLTEYQIYCRNEKYLYFLHKIREQRIYGHSTKKNNGYSLLRRKYLEFYLSTRLFDEIRDDLVKWGVIYWDDNYVTPTEAAFFGVAAKPQGYRLTEHWATQPTVDEMVLNDKMAIKLAVKAKLVKYEKSTHQYLYDCLRYIEIDAEAAYAKADELLSNSLNLLHSLPDNHFSRYMNMFSKYNYYKLSRNLEGASLEELEQDLNKRHMDNRILIQGIELGDIELKPDVYGRVHSVMTNISSALRPYVKYCKQPDDTLWNVDIKNSQPFFLAVQLKEYYLNLDMPSDVVSFIEGCEIGDFYERFMRAVGLNPTDEDRREQVKRLLYRKVLFCKETECEKEDNEVAQYFKSVYPNVLAYINMIKTRTTSYICYKEFGQGLQKTEANVIQKVVAQCQVKGIWVLTIHDSIITLEKHKNEIYSMIKSVCQSECLLTPVLTIKPLLAKEPDKPLYLSYNSMAQEPAITKTYKRDRYSLCTDNYNNLMAELKLLMEANGGNLTVNPERNRIVRQLDSLRHEIASIERKRKRQRKINMINMSCDYSHLQPLVERFSYLISTPLGDDDWDYRDALVRLEQKMLNRNVSILTGTNSELERWLKSEEEWWYKDNGFLRDKFKAQYHTPKLQSAA